MQSQQLIAEIEALDLPEGHYVVVGGASMVIRGLRATTEDIDLVVTPWLFDMLESRGWPQKARPNGEPALKRGHVEICLEVNTTDFARSTDWLISHAEKVGDIPLVDLETLLRWKRGYGREKDARDIELLQDAIRDRKARASASTPCPLCLPRPDDSEQWVRVAKLPVSTLYLDRNQTYRGHCQLVYDEAHVEGLEMLPRGDFARLADDLHRAATAISRACSPDRMNYVSLGNVVPHVHWHLVPRYRSDPRWGAPIYMSDMAEMPVTRLTAGQYQGLVREILGQLESADEK